MDNTILKDNKQLNNEKLGSKKPKTPDFPTVPYKTCDEYKQNMDSGKYDDNQSQKHNPCPTDAMPLKEFGLLSDEEIVKRINFMANQPHKSDIRVMYSNGYGFTWTTMQTIAAFKGFIDRNPGSNTPYYELDEKRLKIASISDFEPICIKHGAREKCERKYSFPPKVADKLDEFFASSSKKLGNNEKSKIVEQMVLREIEILQKARDEGKQVVIYEPIHGETLM